MDDLPEPIAAVQLSANTAGGSQAQQVAPATTTDPKVLQANAVEQTEAAILQTTTSPAERALQVHAIKAAYLKARYNIESKGTA